MTAGGPELDPQAAVDATANPPGQPTLRRQTAPHALALARLRERLAAPGHDLTLRSLARAATDEPAVALLDAWAVVADTVSFYSERIANEGFLRTAVQRGSLRELARTLGYELRPGVAAQVDLAFTAETAAGAPEVVVVPAGTPVQSVPGPGELPQRFETGADLEVRAAWNALPAVESRPQTLGLDQPHVWVRGTPTVRVGDTVLLELTQRVLDLTDVLPQLTTKTRRDVRTIVAVLVDADGPTGWTKLVLDESVPTPLPPLEGVALPGASVVGVHAFRERLRLFGWNAPDPNLLIVRGRDLPGTHLDGDTYVWTNYDVTNPIEVDGDRPALVPGGWVVLDQPGKTEAFAITAVEPDGGAKYALTGPITRVTLADPTFTDRPLHERGYARNQVLVHGASVALTGAEQPDETHVAPTSVVVVASDPPLPPGRRILLSGLVRGTDPATAVDTLEPAVVATDVVACAVDGATMTLTVTGPLPTFARQGLVVLGNVATATHGESVEQVLGSGDGRTPFPVFRPRRSPLTYVRAATPEGARAELVVRVDGVQWQEVESLLVAGPGDRVYVVRHEEDGGVRLVLGDGVHGARPATGVENVTASYRVGIGETGAVGARSVSILVRRPLGIREVTNPVAAQDWAPPETLEEARTTAPQRVRTLGRAVSVADHEDFARGYAGVGPARADLLWDGRVQRVLLTVLGAQASEPSADLVADLRGALDLARDPGSALDVLPGERAWFGVRVEIAHNPARERQPVLDAVLATLEATFDAPARAFATPVTAAGVLVVVRSVPGVAACTVPRLFPLATVPEPPLPPTLPGDEQARDVVIAQPGRYEDGVLRPAQLLALAAGGVQIGVMVG